MTASAKFADLLRDELSPLGSVTTRAMFGRTGVFCEGVMFAMVTENVLYLRVHDQNRVSLQEAEAHPPLHYLLFEEHAELLERVRSALAAAHRVAARRTQRR